MARVLGVGIATLDIVSAVERYPPEDAEVRAISQQARRGGNATNTLVVLSQLGHGCTWLGVLADGPGSEVITQALERHRVDTSACPLVAGASPPTSCITVSRATGSRTIVHYRDLRELTCGDFQALPLEGLDWVHFEGRNVPETRRMLARVRRERPGLPCSVEVEKPREGIEGLFGLADLLLFSRHYAVTRGYATAEAFLEAVRPLAPGATVVCAWGEAGAFGSSPCGVTAASPAYPPPRLVDTVGAGDVLNAACIDGLLRGLPLAQMLERGCRLAGRKCGVEGLDALVDSLELE